MATGRIFTTEWSWSQPSFLRYFSCCFQTENDKKLEETASPTTEEASADSASIHNGQLTHSQSQSRASSKSPRGSVKSTASKSSRKSRASRTKYGAVDDEQVDTADGHELTNSLGAKQDKGGAYAAYEDEETSSDSDDEVLQRYQESMRRASSIRGSAKAGSSRPASVKGSHVSATSSRPSKRDDQEPLVSVSERGDMTASGEQSKLGEQPSSSSATASPEHEAYRNEGYQAGAVSPTSEPGYTDSVEHDEHLFDVSDLQETEPVLISKCGSLEVTFNYDQAKSRMNVTVIQAREIPSKDRGGANHTQIRLLLLPTKKVRHKTKVQQGANPEFQESFHFKVQQEDLSSFGLRFRLYGVERMRRERMIGETVVGFASLNPETATTQWLTLEPRSNLGHGDSKTDIASLTRSDSASSTQSMQHGGMPELLLGLSYNGTTGRLSTEVIKGSNFRNMAMNRAPDTYVKLTLMSPNGQEITRSKTSIRRGQPNPLFKEKFMFQVALFQLADVTLMVSVYNKRSMKRKEMIGWFSLGYNNSGEEESSHWTDMRESKGEVVCRWHMLLEA